jgi:hypothetical protein
MGKEKPMTNRMTLSEVKAYRKGCKEYFEGSVRLFNASWSQYLGYLNGAIDMPECGLDIDDWLEKIAEEKVNNPNSVFYIYG